MSEVAVFNKTGGIRIKFVSFNLPTWNAVPDKKWDDRCQHDPTQALPAYAGYAT